MDTPRKSAQSNVIGMTARHFVETCLAYGGRVSVPRTRGEATRVDFQKAEGPVTGYVSFWFTAAQPALILSEDAKASIAEQLQVDAIYGADVNVLGGDLVVIYENNPDPVHYVVQDAKPAPSRDAEGSAYEKTMPRRLSASAGQAATWMPEKITPRLATPAPAPVAVPESRLSLTKEQAVAMGADADKLTEQFLGAVQSQEAELLKQYAAAFMSMTGLPADRCELLEWTDGEGKAHFRFVPSMPPLSVPDIDATRHPVEILDRLAKASGYPLAEDWDEQCTALRARMDTAVGGVVGQDAREKNLVEAILAEIGECQYVYVRSNGGVEQEVPLERHLRDKFNIKSPKAAEPTLPLFAQE